MWKKIAIGGAVAAAIVGIGTASLAATGDTPTTSGTGSAASGTAPTSAPNSPAGKLRKHPRLEREIGRRTVHGQVVTQNPTTHEFVTHDVIRGSVIAVSSTSITVKAADNTSFTYTVNSDTKVHMRTAGKPGSATKGAIGDVKGGDKVIVIGTGANSPYTATQIIDGVA